MTDKDKIRNELMLRLTYYEESLKVIRNSALNHFITLKIGEVKDLLSFIDSLPEEPASSDLEEASEEYAEDNTYISEQMHDCETQDCMESTADAFKAGANWQKEQMMKDAVKGEICGRLSDHLNIRHRDNVEPPERLTRIFYNTESFKVGDKVKVIIIKED